MAREQTACAHSPTGGSAPLAVNSLFATLARQRHRRLPQSSSASRCTAGASGFLNSQADRRACYDRHGYADEDKRIMAAVARHVAGLVEGTAASNVISLRS